MICAMCGKESELVLAVIEGSELKVCGDCAKFGKVVGVIKPEKSKKELIKEKKIETLIKEPEKEIIKMVVQDYSMIIRKKREEMELKQEEFAKRVNEKESLIQNIETGKFRPSISLARKFERILNLKLIEDYEDTTKVKKGVSNDFTIGDFITIRKKS